MKRRIIAFLTAALLMFPSNLAAAAAAEVQEPPREPVSSTGARVEQIKSSDGLTTYEPEVTYEPDDYVTVIVELEAAPVLHTVDGAVNTVNKSALLSQQKAVQSKISRQVLGGAALEVMDSYSVVVNGFSTKVPFGKLDEIRALSGVANAYVAPEFKVAPDMTASMTTFGGLENSSGYRGEGMVIAIVDSGLEITHSVFKDAPNSPALTQTKVAEAVAKYDLAAEGKMAGVTANQLYRTAKVPFAFDYADNDLDVNPGSAGDHGVHVAGIAAANEGIAADVVGVAPQAQILAMKVFSSSGSNGATWDDILAAMEDAVRLGADVINLSLGATCGYSSPEGDEGVISTLATVVNAGVLLSVAAGNEYSSALGTRIGKGHALTANPDYGTVASPASYGASLAVASVEKAATIQSSYFTVGDRKIAYQDTAEEDDVTGLPADAVTFKSLGASERQFVSVPGSGAAADYEGLDVTGKIVLVSRGSITYEAKRAAAKSAGAAGMIVYNNEPGMLYMQFDNYDLPSAFISMVDGKYLAALAESEQKLTISMSRGEVDNPTDGEMSDFSSWGVTPELTLKPDITAPGGNIKSATVNNGYTTKSGTSMATPYVSGAMAVVKQYLKAQHAGEADDAQALASLTENLLMSTADVLYVGTAPFSPRKQGAGCVAIAAAVSSPAYLTAVGGGRPKIALGDDVGRKGVYTFSFEVHNYSDSAVTYTVGGTVQTDGAEVTGQIGGVDVWQTTEQPYHLSGTVSADSSTVSVAAGETKTVSVTVTLSDADKTYLNTRFENGMYVEGFVTLTPESGAVLSLPYMGFYGDWTEAPVVDATDYPAVVDDGDNWAQAYDNTAGVSSLEGTINTYLGDNPYHPGEVEYLADRNAISPNGDDYLDTLSFVYTGLLRNARTVTYTITDAADSSKVYYTKTVDYEIKSVYSSNYYQIIPCGVESYNKFDPWDGSYRGIKLKNDDKAVVTIECTLPYSEHEVKNDRLSWSFPITIDLEEPEAKNITVTEEDGKYYVDLTVTDNQYVSNVTITNNAESKELASYAVAETTRGAETVLRCDVTGFGENLKIVVNDYACNRKVYQVKAEGNTDNSEVIVPTKSVFKQDFEGDTFPPKGWNVKSTNSSKTWYHGSDYGSKMAMCDHSDTEQQDEWLISPAVDLSQQETKAGIVFDFYTTFYFSVQHHYHNLLVKASTDGENWETIWQLWDWNKNDEFNAWVKTQAKVTIPDKYQDAENVQFAFVYQGKNGSGLWIDNINLYVEDPSMIHTITASASEGGIIDPSGSVTVMDGKSRTFTITPEDKHYIADVKVDGVSVGTPSTYTFSKVTADHTIDVTFGGSDSGQLLIDENFEDGALPEGWVISKTNSGGYYNWRVSQYLSKHWGLYISADEYDSDFSNSGAGQDERIVFAAQDLAGATANLAFQFSANKTRLENGKTVCTLEASTDNGATWTEIWNAKDVVGQLTSGVLNSASSSIGTANVSVAVPEAMLADGVLFSFHYTFPKYATTGTIVFIDNIQLLAEKTSAGDSELILEQDFNDCEVGSTLPDGWTRKNKNSSDTWKISKLGDTLAASCSADTDSEGDYWSGDEYGAGQDEFLISPALNLAGKTATMTFEFSGQKNSLSKTVVSNKTTATLEASLDGGKTWTEIWNAADGSDQLVSGVHSSYVASADFTVEIPEDFLQDGVQFAFRYQTKFGNTGGCTVYVDNIKIFAAGGSQPQPPVEETVTITASAGQGGTITPSGTVTVTKGENQTTFAIAPSEGYEIEDVLVNGQSVGAVETYTFANITENQTIAAFFKTLPEILPTSIHEDFNTGFLPEGWTTDGLSKYYETWKIARSEQLNNSNVAVCTQNFMGMAGSQNEYLILPRIQMQSNMLLTFDFAAAYSEVMTGAIKFTVKATVNNGQSWTEIWNAQTVLSAVSEDDADEYVTGKGSVSIPAAYCTAEARFAFVFESASLGKGSVEVDNVVLDAGGAVDPTLYGITIAAMTNGTVTADRSVAAAGETVTLTVTPAAGYHLKEGSLKANDEVISGNTFIMPARAVTVTALFEQDAVTPTVGEYKDGTYEGTAQGKIGPVTVRVTVENGFITSVEVLEQKETKTYWEMAVEIIKRIIGIGNDTDLDAVDTVTEATKSSEAIKEAVKNALHGAIRDDSGIFDSGNGTEQSPYLICTVAQLQAFAAAVNAGTDYAGKFVALGANINMTGETFTPIGYTEHSRNIGFAGTFDGRGYAVTHITCGTGSAPARYESTGFFGVVARGGVVKNLNVGIDKFYNDYSVEDGIICAGGIAGVLESGALIDHCSVSGGDQTFSINSGKTAAIGGLVGRMMYGSSVSNSWSDVGLSYGTTALSAVVVSMGGICGKQEQGSLIANCASFGTVPGMIGTGTLRVGGLVGCSNGAVYNCYTNSKTKANILLDDASTAIGFLVGSTESGCALYQCYYDKNADQLSNVDLAGDPSEGKTERRQVTGWDNGSAVKIDETYTVAKTASELASSAFASVLNDNRKNTYKTAASTYFKSLKVLDSDVSIFEDRCDNGFLQWALTGDRVLFGDIAVVTYDITFVELLAQQNVPFGTAKGDIVLPAAVEVTLDNNTTRTLSVVWSCDNYNGQKAGSYTFTGTLVLADGITNTRNFMAYVVVNVGEEETGTHSITAVSPVAGRTVPVGTAQSGISLPETVEVTLDDNTKRNVSVVWSCDSYDGQTAGSYIFTGTLILPDGITNPNGLTASVVVTVADSQTKAYSLTVIGGTGSGTYAAGDLVWAAAVAPSTGKVFTGWTAVGITLFNASEPSLTFIMPDNDVILVAHWENASSGGGQTGGQPSTGNPTGTYKVSVEPAVNGKVSADKTSAEEGAKVALTVMPDVGYALRGLTISDTNGKKIFFSMENGKYTFTMPASDVTVKAVFAKNSSNSFSDVAEGDYFYDAVKWAVENGVTNGTGGTAFSPDMPCTRAQIVTFLWRAAGSPAPKSSVNPFADVSYGAYYYSAVLWAVENGITKGTTDTTFSPDAVCSRGESVTFIYRDIQRNGGGFTGAWMFHVPFTDVPDWAFEAVAWCYMTGITKGTGKTTFSVNADCTRGQIVTLLYRAYQDN